MRFLSDRDGLGPIFSSVYLNPAAELLRQGVDAGTAVLCSVGEYVKPPLREKWSQIVAANSAAHGAPIERLMAGPKNRTPDWADHALLARWAARHARGSRVFVAHCGSARMAGHMLRIRRRHRNLRVVYHVWGPDAAELAFSGSVSDKKELEQIDQRQRLAVQGADAVISIGNRMTRWLEKNFGPIPGKILEVPCFVESRRFAASAGRRDALRAKLGVSGHFVVTYSGSMLSWQLPPRALEAVRVILENDPQAIFLGLTMHQKTLRERLRRDGIPEHRARIETVPHGEMADYLAASDLGIVGRSLLADESVVNTVSSPIKFGEYIAAGTPVVISEGVGDFSGLTEREGLGAVIPFNAPADVVRERLSGFRERYRADEARIRDHCMAIAARELDIRHHCARMRTLYEDLARHAG